MTVLKLVFKRGATLFFSKYIYSHGGPMDWEQELKDQEEEAAAFGKYAELSIEDLSCEGIEIEYCTSY
tara:strand:+ start:264 stop:467 length:204 start_codon:yes stop_codon:yes gene_type:complete